MYYASIMTNSKWTLYTGVTNDLTRRVYEHKNKLVYGFTSKYNITKLVFYESTSEVDSAIAREKQIKGWRRSKKIALINSVNPKWRDLAVDWDELGNDCLDPSLRSGVTLRGGTVGGRTLLKTGTCVGSTA